MNIDEVGNSAETMMAATFVTVKIFPSLYFQTPVSRSRLVCLDWYAISGGKVWLRSLLALMLYLPQSDGPSVCDTKG
jgi:hypothetical protein